jgi:diacylglycerol kinase family enzyme
LSSDPGVSTPVPISTSAPLFVVLNRGSGKHAEDDVRLAIEAELTAAGRTFSVLEVDEPAQLASIAAQAVVNARERRGIVVAAGGDGTINAVAAATLGSGCAFGVLPLGTFNYFSRAHGISSEVRAACQVLLGARAVDVQVGLVNDRVFLVNGSLGAYPELLEEREAAKQRLGRSRLVAIGAGLGSLLRSHRHLRLDIEEQSGRRRRVVAETLFVSNNRLQLQRVGIAESELVERGRLVAVVVKPTGVLATLALVLRALLGKLSEADEVMSFDFQRMTVRPRLGKRRIKIATDGEVVELPLPLTFRVAPHALRLLRPAVVGEDPG